MAVLVCILVLICIVLAVQLIRYERGLKSLEDQLSFLEEGSRIEVTTALRSRQFLGLCRRLNRLMEEKQADDRRLVRSKEQLKQTVTNIAHDIRTPLTAASGYLQMLKEGGSPEQKERYIRVIESRLQVLKDMLEELFLHTKLADEDYTLSCTSVEIYPLMCDCLLGFYNTFEELDVEPEVIFENVQMCVNGNPEGLDRVFRNLVLNALQHGTGGLKIVQYAEELVFSNPIDERLKIDTDSMFDRFYKADAFRQKASSGLGLAIVRELMERMGGSAEAAVNENTIEIRLRFREALSDR